MKKMNIVRNTITEGTETYRERSRIGSINHRIWSVIAPMLFIAFGLFGVNVNAWATWPTYSGSCTTSGYVVYDASLELNTIDAEEINLAGPGYEITFEAKHTLTGAGDLKVAQYVDGNWSDAMWSDNPGEKKQGIEWKTNKWGISYPSYYDYWDYKSYTVSTKLNPRATKIKFYTEVGATLYKTVQNIRVTRYSNNAYALYDDNLDCGSADYNLANSDANHTSGTAYVDWSHKSTAPSCTITGTNAEYFYVKSTSNPPSNDNYGAMSVEVAYKHTAPGDHSATLNVGGKTITVNGHTNKITPYIVTTPTVDTITYGQTISNSQLHGGLVKADLINNTGATVAGTWTIDENGQTVTTSGGQSTTVNLTFTPSDQNTYNVKHTTQTMFVRSASMITWASAYSATKPTIPVGKTIESAATTTAAGATITYSTSNPDVIVIENEGTTFRAIAEGEATITASHGVTPTHGAASAEKTFKTTYKDIQVIVWNDRFDRLTTEMTSKNLLAQVWIENPVSGERTYSAARTALLEYSVVDNTVVSIPENSTTLTIHKKGNTTLTASVEGNDQYESASVTMEVKVREPSAGCDDPLLLDKKNNGTNDYLYRLFSDDTKKPALYSDEYAINVAQGQVPDKLSFAHKGEEYKVIGLSFWTYYSGTIKAQQKVNGNWIDVPNSSVTPEKSKWNTIEGLQLNEGATHIRFVRPQGGEGYHYVRNVEVTMKHFIRTATPTVDFGNTIKVNSSEYRDVVINYSNVKGSLQVTNPFTSDVTVSDEIIDIEECGAFGSATLRIYFNPTTATQIENDIVVKDPIIGNSSALSIHVTADVQRADQTIDWSPETNISTIDQILLNGTTNGQEQGQMNVITYTVTNNEDVISVTNNVVTVLKPGTVTITAKQNGSANYEAATPVEKNFTISAETLTILEAPTASGNLTYGQTLSDVTVIGGSVQDSKGNTVAGSFSWQTATTAPNAGDNQNFTVVFTPEENAAWYNTLTTSVAVNVAAAAPEATPSAPNIVYGQKVNESVLSNVGTDGTWAWNTENNEAVLDAGTHEGLAVHFTPTSGNYTELDATVTLTIEKANPELTAQASAITYGQAISASELSTATGNISGTWAWAVDTTQVLSVGNHALKANFTSTNANYSDLSNVDVTLIVNKIETLEVPVALSFCAGSSVNFHGNTYTEAGEHQVEAEGDTRDTVYNVTVTKLQPTTGTDSKTIAVGANESWNGINLSGYVVGSHEVVFHTENVAGCDSTVTLSLTVVPATNIFTNATENGDWDDPANWQSGIVPTGDPNIFVTGDLVIDEDITVGNLTIESTGSVAVISGGTLTVNGTSEDRTEYGDVHVMSDGALALGNSANLQVRDFTLDAALGNSSNAATSGQVNGDIKLHINRDAYFQMSFDPRGEIDYGWYDFTVPFEVEVLNGVYDSLMNKLTNGPDYVVMNFNEARRASSGKGWGSFAGTMQPGRIYSIGFDDDRTWNTFIFKKKSGSNLLSNGSFTAECSNSGVADDRGWNGLGNGTLQHRELTELGSRKVQVYNHSEDNYTTYDADEKAYAVGTAFFLQADEYLSSISLTATDGSKALRAPQYASRELDEFRLTLTAEGDDRYADRMWVSASEEATGEYVIGHDLLKMGTPKNAKVAQMWTVSNDLRLCDIEMPLINDMSQCPLMFFAPNAQTYEIAVDQAPEDATLYLTYNDRIIWSLSASPYTIDLTKGTTEGYGLRIVARHNAPSVATGIDELNVDQDGNRKVLIDNMLYIITPEGAMYSVTGEKVK